VTKKSTVLPEPCRPIGQCWSLFLLTLSQVSAYTAWPPRGVPWSCCSYTSELSLVPTGSHGTYPARVGQLELTWVACYVPRRWHLPSEGRSARVDLGGLLCTKTVYPPSNGYQPSTNRAQQTETTLTEANTLSQSQTTHMTKSWWPTTIKSLKFKYTYKKPHT